MLITPDNIGEKSRAIIRSASEAAFARRLRRANRIHRLLLTSLAVSVLAVVFALATRTAGWTIVMPLMIAVVFRHKVERDEGEADVMKIALKPEVVAEIRRTRGSQI